MRQLVRAAKEWAIPAEELALLCAQDKLPGAVFANGAWFLPDDAARPVLARPFLKWAGGKGRSLWQIRPHYPPFLGGAITRYVEPFVGGGAVLLDVLSHYHIQQAYVSDTNRDLINAYRSVKSCVEPLIGQLGAMSAEYLPLGDGDRKAYYYEKRQQFNAGAIPADAAPNPKRAALFLFLNRTCYNGLYRVSQSGQFNVPMGRYKNPQICNAPALRAASAALQEVQLFCGDYEQSADFIDAQTFVYLDPPYRPLSKTSSFTAYTKDAFDDNAQRRLADFFAEMARRGASVLLSNSDPKNTDPKDDFFDALYRRFHIHRIPLGRAINAKGGGRGQISELLISSYTSLF